MLSYSYDSAGELTQVKDTAHNITYFQNASYFPAGQLNQATYGSVVETSIFNNRLQPCWYFATTGTPLAANTACGGTATAANVLDLKYNFGFGTNDNGDVQSLTNDKDSNRSVSYTYDALNRVASAATPNADCTVLASGITRNWGETFTIDAWGNLTNRTVTKCSADPLSVVALPNNQLSGFGYDAAGNMISNGGASYNYNAESQLASTAGVTYTYDGDGNRVKKSNGTEYWGAGPLLESDGNGSLQREFIFAGGRRIARRDIASGTVYYYFTDLLGSSDVVTTSAGTIQNESDYFPYGGERLYSQAVTNQNYKFTGKERDGESGLDNFGARYDSSNLGRFMTPDWAARPTAVPYAVFGDPQSLNLYGYVRNDPVSRADADGHLVNAQAPADSDETTTMWDTKVDQKAEEGADSPGRQAQNTNQQTASSDKPWDFRKNVVDLLRAKNGCSDWFNTGTGSAADTMSNVPITLGKPPKGPIPGPDAETSESPKSPIEVNPKGRFYSNSDNQLLVGDKYKPGSDGARMTIMLHELAHKMQLIPHDGRIDSPPGQSEKNTQTVIEHCADAIGP